MTFFFFFSLSHFHFLYTLRSYASQGVENKYGIHKVECHTFHLKLISSKSEKVEFPTSISLHGGSVDSPGGGSVDSARGRGRLGRLDGSVGQDIFAKFFSDFFLLLELM